MVHHPALLDILGIAAELFAINGNVVSAIHFSRHPQFGKCAGYWIKENRKINNGFFVFLVGNISKTQITHILIHRAPARQTLYHLDIALFHNILLYFIDGILINTNNDAVIILPEHKILVTSIHFVKNILL